MTTIATANRYCELARQNKWTEILDELCSKDLVNKNRIMCSPGAFPSAVQ